MEAVATIGRVPNKLHPPARIPSTASFDWHSRPMSHERTKAKPPPTPSSLAWFRLANLLPEGVVTQS